MEYSAVFVNKSCFFICNIVFSSGPPPNTRNVLYGCDVSVFVITSIFAGRIVWCSMNRGARVIYGLRRVPRRRGGRGRSSDGN
jgi:hypothetical protein